MSDHTSEDQIMEAFNRLSPKGKRKVLSRMIPGLAELDRIVDKNQEKLRAICRERGMDFDGLNEEQREDLIDEILHEG